VVPFLKLLDRFCVEFILFAAVSARTSLVNNGDIS
jgi:hypothetical protein